MGEIAEGMLDGTFCEGCGEYLGSDAGFPQYCCDQCARDRGAATSTDLEATDLAPPAGKRFRCDICKKRFHTEQGRRDHGTAKHGGF